MIILFPQDVAKGYDDLSILSVKRHRLGDTPSNPLNEPLNRAHAILQGQVGHDRHEQVLCSREYQHLFDLNQRLFDEFDWLHTKGPSAPAEEVKARAIETDRINGVDRPAAKRALQERWFGTVPTEVKIGYGKEAT